jgi:uncharacterized membrane protein HdeD (DUF308 family)/predicted flap endonuclease-1-like 5' DNA nuclease
MSSSTTALRKVPRWLAIILGIASIAIGVLFLRNPGRTLVGLAIVLGIWLLIVGIGQIISIFGDSPGSRMFKLTAGIFGIAAGVIVLSRPMFAGLTTGVLFNWLMGIFAIVIGIALFIDGFRGGGALAIILGILAIVLGVLLLFHPMKAVLALPVWLGISAIAGGVAIILAALFARRSPEPSSPVVAGAATGASVAAVSSATAEDQGTAATAPMDPAVTPSGDVAEDMTGGAVDTSAEWGTAAGVAVTGAVLGAAADDDGPGEGMTAAASTEVVDDANSATNAAVQGIPADEPVEDEVDWQNHKLRAGTRSIEGIGPEFADTLRANNILTPGDLLQLGATRQGREKLAKATGIPLALLLRWINQADLYRVKGIGEEYAELLEASGVDTVVELAQRNPTNLINRMTSANSERQLVQRLPFVSEVESWVRQAKELPRVVFY